ncbi:hypothetical protein GGR57DRAFT_235153 [Xylariaceae sp. FL1272]|nr:hypothetical protein GGR57DRAFT_235153 [Xylariaceae sp. FL1272]
MDSRIQIRSGLQSQGIPSPSLAWIQGAMPNRSPLPPLPALIATVKTRLLAADLTSGQMFDSLPPTFASNASSLEVRESRLLQDTPVQVLDIENLSKSRWEQVEELEAISRGEQTKGREIVRLPTGNDDDESMTDTQPNQTGASGAARSGATAATSASTAASKSSTHRLIVQDCKGQKMYALELKRIEKIGINSLNIGEKIMLKKGTLIARGTILLEPTTCTILGGKVEAWQKSWVEGRLARLQAQTGGSR